MTGVQELQRLGSAAMAVPDTEKPAEKPKEEPARAMSHGPLAHSAIYNVSSNGLVVEGTQKPRGGRPSPSQSNPDHFRGSLPSTFDVLASLGQRIGRPEDLLSLRSSRRSLKVCASLQEMLADVDNLTYISRGATSVVFHGVWEGAEVAVKFLLGNYTNHNASVREALLGTEISHPNVVCCFTTRCCTLSADFLIEHMDGIDMAAAEEVVADSAPALLPKTLYRTDYQSGEGFGPPPSSAMMDYTAQEAIRAASSKQPPKPPTPQPERSPWGGKLTWGNMLRFISAKPHQVLTLVLAEYCDAGTLSGAIHDMRVFEMGRPDIRSDTYRLALRALLRTAREATMGLHHLHQSGIIHGDIKPGNILLISTRTDRRGFVAKLTDLGAARVVPDFDPSEGLFSMTHRVSRLVKDVDWGTTPYMAPEHFAGTLMPASDIFSLGVTLWEMCHAQRPYEQYTPAEVSRGVVDGSLKLDWTAQVPPALVDLVAKCLQHSPSKRPTTAQIAVKLAAIEAQLRLDLRRARIIDHLRQPIVPIPRPQQPQQHQPVATHAAPSTHQQQVLHLQQQLHQSQLLVRQLAAASAQRRGLAPSQGPVPAAPWQYGAQQSGSTTQQAPLAPGNLQSVQPGLWQTGQSTTLSPGATVQQQASLHGIHAQVASQFVQLPPQTHPALSRHDLAPQLGRTTVPPVLPVLQLTEAAPQPATAFPPASVPRALSPSAGSAGTPGMGAHLPEALQGSVPQPATVVLMSAPQQHQLFAGVPPHSMLSTDDSPMPSEPTSGLEGRESATEHQVQEIALKSKQSSMKSHDSKRSVA